MTQPVPTLLFEDVPSTRTNSAGRGRVHRTIAPEAVPTFGRRSVLKMAIAAGAVASVTTLRLFQAARPAGADPADSYDGYQIWRDTADGPCHQTVGYARNHNCDPICGPSVPSYGYCTTATFFGGAWHRDGSYGGDSYWLRPNWCGDNDEPNDNGKDGWLWKCGSTPYRCHDGWKSTPNGPLKTICRTSDLS